MTLRRTTLRLEALEVRETPAALSLAPADRSFLFASSYAAAVTPVTPPADPLRGSPTAGTVPLPLSVLTPVLLATTPLPLNDGSNPYWMAREGQIEARILQGPTNVLFLGDSITDGLQRLPVWPQYFAPLGAADFGVSAVTTSQVLWQLQMGHVAAMAPEAVVLMVGTNNLGQGQSPGETAAGITAIVTQIEAQLPRTRIVLLGLLPRGQSPADPYRPLIAEVNRLIAPLADGRRVQYLDMGPAFLQPDGKIAPEVMADYLHPTPYGYELYAAALRPLLPRGAVLISSLARVASSLAL